MRFASQVAGDASAADARWVRHFSEIEAGGPLSAEAIAKDCFVRQASHDQDDLVVNLEDGVRADFLHKYPGRLSKHLYSPLLTLGLDSAVVPALSAFVTEHSLVRKVREEIFRGCDKAVVSKFQGALAAMARLMLQPAFSLEQESLDWLRELFRQGGRDVGSFGTWQDVVALSKERPSVWRRAMKAAKAYALLRAQWEAEKKQFLGLLLRQLRCLGATCQDDIEQPGPCEVCAVCQKSCANLRAWSHHAFNVHGRLGEERHLVAGSQCPVCLTQFPNTEKLCNHEWEVEPLMMDLLSFCQQCKMLVLEESYGTATEQVASIGELFQQYRSIFIDAFVFADR
ncbi:hypothetical protein AK812_SmicGene38063 [Symbiodinium microadriaticum]|uniref:Uncharacterized protein n=1 Tax=Symbiodinium microadriaticum TaxID=2951 RepID=A0A1Q9CEN4_SYMMI|nr:hypothetical protein AK812_SmicGene38063 [Symbiodinium microadriaticum]